MNRCFAPATVSRSFTLAALVALAVSSLPLAALAQQGPRVFPAHALRGTLEITTPPQVLLNGKADRLSPGSRIRTQQNLLALSGSLVGQKWLVNYVRDGSGLIHEAWILTPEEAREKRAGAAPEPRLNITIGVK